MRFFYIGRKKMFQWEICYKTSDGAGLVIRFFDTEEKANEFFDSIYMSRGFWVNELTMRKV